MTVKEFSQKYGIPYAVVYAATFHVSATRLSPLDRCDYKEEELYEAMVNDLEKSIKKHTGFVVSRTEMLKKLTEKGRCK